MDMGLTVPKWVLIIWPKIYTPNAPEFISQFVCPSPKVLDFNEKRLHWASVVRDFYAPYIFMNVQLVGCLFVSWAKIQQTKIAVTKI